MKKLFFSLIVLFVTMFSSVCAETVLEGRFEGSNVFSSVNLNSMTTGRPMLMSTFVISPDGTFRCATSAIDHTDIFQLEFRSSSSSIRQQILLVLSPDDAVSVTLRYEGNRVVLADASGSADLLIQKEFSDKETRFYSEMARYETLYNSAADNAARQRISNEFNTAYTNLMNENLQYLYSNSSSLSSILCAYTAYESDFEQPYIRSLFESLYNSLKDSYNGNILLATVDYKLSNPIVTGKVAPELEGNTPDGRVIRLSDMRGKVVLIDFWASWCRPCRAENPNVVKAYKAYHDKGFEVFSVSLDADANSWNNAIKADGLEWTSHVCSFKRWSCPMAQKYRVNSIPFSVLVGKDGKIIATGLRGERLQSELSKLLD